VSKALPPPDIPGLTYLEKLGAGGYADVYLYQQQMPSRRVAVKVLRETGLSASAVARFTAEANAMARLEHPHIVPVYAAGATPDGRPYIVMMYYPKASLAERARAERFAVDEVLRIGIQIGSAVETAHRSGLLHRDIKPANVLTNQYGTPGLTDFGIAAQVAESDDDDTGVSVPWSPPEVLYATAPASVRSDVFSLAATLWHLLVGRSPFEIPGGDNSPFALMRRIRDNPAPSTGRANVPAPLERLLRSAMARDPAMRPASALDFVRSLQAIEQDLRYQRTPVVIADETSVGAADPDRPSADATRVQAAQVVQAQRDLPAVPGGRTAARPREAASPEPAAGTVRRSAVPENSSVAPAEATRQRAAAVEPLGADDVDDLPDLKPRWWVVAGAVAVLVGIIGVGVTLASGQPSAEPQAADVVSAPVPQVGDAVLPPGPLEITASETSGRATFTWEYTRALDDDSFQWRKQGDKQSIPTTVKKVEIPVSSSGPTCIEVRVVRANGTFADQSFKEKCL